LRGFLLGRSALVDFRPVRNTVAKVSITGHLSDGFAYARTNRTSFRGQAACSLKLASMFWPVLTELKHSIYYVGFGSLFTLSAIIVVSCMTP
jgi:hypothetical protein